MDLERLGSLSSSVYLNYIVVGASGGACRLPSFHRLVVANKDGVSHPAG